MRRINFLNSESSKLSRNSVITVFNDESPNSRKRNMKIAQKSAQLKKFESICFLYNLNQKCTKIKIEKIVYY